MIDQPALDSEVIKILREALDRAWSDLPSARSTPETKDRMARALVYAAKAGERDVGRLEEVARAAGLEKF